MSIMIKMTNNHDKNVKIATRINTCTIRSIKYIIRKVWDKDEVWDKRINSRRNKKSDCFLQTHVGSRRYLDGVSVGRLSILLLVLVPLVLLVIPLKLLLVPWVPLVLLLSLTDQTGWSYLFWCRCWIELPITAPGNLTWWNDNFSDSDIMWCHCSSCWIELPMTALGNST